MPIGHPLDLLGQTFGRVTVLRKSERSGHWHGRCACGTEREFIGKLLARGHTSSCGCLKREVTGAKRRTHGRSKSIEYNSWCAMKDRCYNPENAKWPRYGGRGIVVCDRWLHSFEAFLADMGERPSGKRSLDRVDNDGPYCRDNCRWADWNEQARNRSTTHMLTFRGETKSLRGWAECLGMPEHAIYNRLLKFHWTTDRALSTPYHPHRKKVR